MHDVLRSVCFQLPERGDGIFTFGVSQPHGITRVERLILTPPCHSRPGWADSCPPSFTHLAGYRQQCPGVRVLELWERWRCRLGRGAWGLGGAAIISFGSGDSGHLNLQIHSGHELKLVSARACGRAERPDS